MARRMIVLAISLLVVSLTVYAYHSDTWTGGGSWGNGEWTRAGDFDGNGTTDIVSPNFGYWVVKYSNAVNSFVDVGTGNRCTPPTSFGQAPYVRVGDFNGDGVADYISPSGGTAYMYLFQRNQSGQFPPPAGYSCPLYSAVPIDSTWGSAD